MKDRLLYAGLVMALAVMAAAFGYGAWHTYVESRRMSDFESWVQTPGVLESLEIEQTLHRYRWQYLIASKYAYVVDGTTYTGRHFDLDKPVFKTADEAKAFAETALGLARPADWRAVTRGTFDGWVLEVGRRPVTVRHSPRDPTAATLTATPPMAEILDWVVIAALSLLALATGLGSVALLGAAVSRSSEARTI